ncbi:MAG: iron ABC transporter permease [Planctomycetes bacterium]|nr:iron ABC transporter permease [Planctomycetota bacterium]
MSAPQPPHARRALLGARSLALCGGALVPLLCFASLCVGNSGLRIAPADAWSGLRQHFGWASGLPTDPIVDLRLWQALTTAGVGAALGLAGALVQGLFRNPLASPSILGISSGASLGAVGAVVMLGTVHSESFLLPSGADAGWMVPLCAFAGAIGAGAFVFRIATSAGRVSIPALLLMGIAINTILGGLMQWIQSSVLDDNYLSKSILSWSFGSLDDRTAPHALLVWCGLALGLAALPFVSYELDLMQTGLEDAEALGVNTARVRWIALCAATLSASGAVAVAGQIAFVGLIVPHLSRMLSGRSHRVLLWSSALLGALFLLGVQFLQFLVLGARSIPPGVLLSLLGGPFFLALLWSKRRELAFW